MGAAEKLKAFQALPRYRAGLDSAARLKLLFSLWVATKIKPAPISSLGAIDYRYDNMRLPNHLPTKGKKHAHNQKGRLRSPHCLTACAGNLLSLSLRDIMSISQKNPQLPGNSSSNGQITLAPSEYLPDCRYQKGDFIDLQY